MNQYVTKFLLASVLLDALHTAVLCENTTVMYSGDYANKTMNIPPIEMIVSWIVRLPSLNANTTTDASLLERRKQCVANLQVAILDTTVYDQLISAAKLRGVSPTNKSHMLQELCKLEAWKAYADFYFEKWANSLEGYISKVWIKGIALPVLQAVNLLSLIFHGVPNFSRLLNIYKSSAKWYLLYAYVNIALAHALCCDLVNLILRIMNWFGDYQSLIKYTRPENFSDVACPVFIFVKQLLSFLPNWIVLLLLWDEIIRRRFRKKPRAAANIEGRTISRHEEISRVLCSEAKVQSNRSTIARKEQNPTMVSPENAVIRNGLTRFGAKLITITLLVMHVITNIHSLWLFSVVDGKCQIDVGKHSKIFAVGYPYFLQFIHSVLPNVGCLMGVGYSAWLSVANQRSLTHCPNAEPSSKLPCTSKSSVAVYDAPPSCDGQLREDATRQISRKFCICRRQSCMLEFKINAADFTTHSVDLSKLSADRHLKDLSKRQFKFCQSERNSFLMLGLGVCYLLYLTPENIEWFCMTKVGELTEKDLAQNYEVVKFWYFVTQVIQCWSLFSKTVFILLTLCLSSTVRQQFFHTYSSAFQCRHHKCAWCCCGFYCNMNKINNGT
ncbi:hypothetical protein CRM22_001031 [Opisthorchis felineus]|uniref:Uncharacterized protein n=1 Tax=Opisthorchis felineus TaxID=147828 RepID=A0A4S2MJ03_OPIFE|nr:hypothetical protein CRM22_001031 [Opisthorchis felineus]